MEEAIKTLEKRKSEISWQISKLQTIRNSLDSAIYELKNNISKEVSGDE